MTIANDLSMLRDSCMSYAKDVEKQIANPGNDLRAMCFWNIHNRVKLTEEIMVMYERVWSSENFPDVDQDVSAELTERVIMITKDLFIDVVSMIEKTMKDSLKFHTSSGLKEAALKRTSHLYMRNILLSGLEMGYIEKSVFDEWDLLLMIRNLAAHNNSIADRQGKFRISDIEISMRPGRMMKGPLNTYIVLSERMIAMFFDWLSKLKKNFSS
ncbi:MAG: hypothetical protein IJT54_03655 [Candidatus Methanomethylophilaceae archaeon]|nr:hypothetical protein [Candidatus Methanomethylophilaceae archaeon]